MIKKLFLFLFLSFVVVGNIDAQKHKKNDETEEKRSIPSSLVVLNHPLIFVMIH